MAGRLGHVLYVLGCIAAGLLVLLGVAVMAASGASSSDRQGVLIFFLIVGAAAWGIGWAARYVLSGQ